MSFYPHFIRTSYARQLPRRGRGIFILPRITNQANNFTPNRQARTIFTPANPFKLKPADNILGSLERQAQLLGGQPRWGFPVLRGSYSDDEAWERAENAITAAISEPARREGHPELIDLHMATVLADPQIDSATGATKAQVRQKLLDWANREMCEVAALVDPAHLRARLVEEYAIANDESLFTATAVEMVRHALVLSPRFSYCIYVNQQCLDSFEGFHPVVILIQKDWEPSDTEPDDDAYGIDTAEYPIEGYTDYDVGWAYMYLADYWDTYAKLCRDSGSWEDFYSRPPWPIGVLVESEPFGPERWK